MGRNPHRGHAVNAAATPFTLGQHVEFRPEFSEALRGVVFEVDEPEGATTPEGRKCIGLRRRSGGRWGYRLAWVDDLRAVD